MFKNTPVVPATTPSLNSTNNRDRFMQQARRPSLSRDTRDTRDINNNVQQQQPSITATTNVNLNKETTLYKSEMITPQEHEEYFHQNIKQIAKIACTDLMDNFQQLFSTMLCPLQTPLELTPHHVNKRLDCEAACMQVLNDELNKLTEFRNHINHTTMLPVGTSDPNTVMDPNYAALQDLALKYRNHVKIESRITYIMILIKQIQDNCSSMWKIREQVHKNIQQSFEETIRRVCSNFAQHTQRLCPDLRQFIIDQKLIEAKLHKKQPIANQEYNQKKTVFYSEVIIFATEQANLVKDILNVLRIMIHEKQDSLLKIPAALSASSNLSHFDKNKYDRYFKRYQDLDTSLNIWLKILTAQGASTSSLPILSFQMEQLQQLLLKIQSFMLHLIEDWTPKLPRPIRPDAPSTHAINNTNNQAATYGLLDLDPKLFNFLNESLVNASEDFEAKEQENNDIIQFCNELQQKILTMSGQFEDHLSIKELNGLVTNYSTTTRQAAVAIASRSNISEFHDQSYKLQTELKWLKNQQELATDHLKSLKPRIETQKTLVQSLNHIIGTLNNFSDHHKTKWMNFIRRETLLCQEIKSETSDYRALYLQFRSDTRMLTELQLEEARNNLNQLIRKCLLDLVESIQGHMSELQQATAEHLIPISQNRQLIQTSHREIIDPASSEQEDPYNVQTGQQITLITSYVDNSITTKEKQDWAQYVLDIQDMFILFIKSLIEMVKVLTNDSEILDYLTTLDHVCIEENKLGSAPLPRSSCGSNGNIINQWIQLIDLPDRIQPAKMLSSTESERQAAEKYHKTYDNSEIHDHGTTSGMNNDGDDSLADLIASYNKVSNTV